MSSLNTNSPNIEEPKYFSLNIPHKIETRKVPLHKIDSRSSGIESASLFALRSVNASFDRNAHAIGDLYSSRRNSFCRALSRHEQGKGTRRRREHPRNNTLTIVAVFSIFGEEEENNDAADACVQSYMTKYHDSLPCWRSRRDAVRREENVKYKMQKDVCIHQTGETNSNCGHW